MKKMVSAAEANRHFSHLLNKVKEGVSYTVTSHGRSVANLTPANSSDEDATLDQAWKDHLEKLRKQPVLNLGPFSRDEAYE